MSIFDFDDLVIKRRTGKPLQNIIATKKSLNDIGNKLATYLKLDMDDGPWLAGGSVRKLYHNIPVGYSDWDIFFKDYDQFNTVRQIIQNDPSSTLVHESSNAMTYTFDWTKENVPFQLQIIKRKYYQSVIELLNDFDFSICKYATDGTSFSISEEALLDEKRKILRCDLSKADRPGFIKRIIKYIVYGYTPSQELLQYIYDNHNVIDFNTMVDDYEL